MKTAAKLAFPIVLGQLGMVLTGVADTIMVGNLGRDMLASVNQANNIFFMASAITFGILFSVSTLVSIKVGEGKAGASYITYRAGLLVCLILFAFQFVLLESIAYNFDWLGQSRVVNENAPSYLHIINLSILPMLVFITARQFTDGLGHTMIAMYVTVAGLLLNIFLNWVMIYGKLGCPAMGIEGAGYATLISRIAMAVMAVFYVRYSRLTRQYRPDKMPQFKEVRAELPEIWKMGLPISLQTFAEWACFSISGIMVGWLGASQLAAHAVALNVASVTYMVVSGLAIAGSIMVGNAFGEANKFKIRRVANAILWMTLTLELTFALGILLMHRQIAALYNVELQVAKYVYPLLFMAAAFQLADGIQAAAMNVLRGIKDVNAASGISVVSYWVISLPLGYFLGIAMEGNVYGIWLGFTIGLFLAAVFGVTRFYVRLRSLTFED